MLLEEKKVSIEASGMKDTADFRANLDGMMFDNLINGIYSNKIAAGIREYSTNARDGHARRGNLDTPFEVGLPTKDKAFFEVRDFGSSLTHQEVFDIFVVLGESTKRVTNDETGCLGLGSKSAFAYTNSFTVTCWKNGSKRDYSCYIGEAGKPKVSLISEIKSREPEGVRVSYAVKNEDIDDFNLEATKQLRGFDPQPKIIRHNSKYKPLNEQELLLEGKSWKLYKSEKPSMYQYHKVGKPMAIQGSVAYPIDATNVSLKTALRTHCAEKFPAAERLLTSTDILIKFDIGEIRMVTSREELAYDDRTCENIAKKINHVIDDIQKVMDEEYSNCTSLKEARILRAKSIQSSLSDLEKVLGTSDRYWNGKKIEQYMVFGMHEGKIGPIKGQWQSSYFLLNMGKTQEFESSVKGDLRIIEQHNYRQKFGEIKARFQWPNTTNKNAIWNTRIHCHKVSDVKVLVDIKSETIDKNVNSLIRRYWKDTLESKDNLFMWIKVDSEADAKTFLESIYHDKRSNVTYLHKLTELKTPKNSSKNSVVNTANPMERKFRFITAQGFAYNGEPAKYENIDFSNQTTKLPVCFFRDNIFYLNQNDMEKEMNGRKYQNFCNFIHSWDNMGYIYVINGQQLKFYKENKNKFQELMPHLKKKWLAKDPDWEKIYAESQHKGDDSENADFARKFWILSTKKGITFKSIEPYLKRDKDKIENGPKWKVTKYSRLPIKYDIYLKAELDAAIAKYPQPNQDKAYVKFVEKDPILKYLIRDVKEYIIPDDLTSAIQHWKKNNQE